MAGPQCCENPPALSSWCGAGAVEEIAGLNAYIVGSTNSKAAVILISDIFDKVAASGFYVVLPDFFHGDPFSYLKYGTSVDEWLEFHRPEKGYEPAKAVVEALKKKGISATGATGICWGAKATVELGKAGDIKAAVLMHPTLVFPEDIKAINCPICVLGAQVDPFAPPEVLKQFEEVLSTRPEINNLVKVYPDTHHGWTVRYNIEDEVAVKQADEAHRDMLNWLITYVN